MLNEICEIFLVLRGICCNQWIAWHPSVVWLLDELNNFGPSHHISILPDVARGKKHLHQTTKAIEKILVISNHSPYKYLLVNWDHVLTGKNKIVDIIATLESSATPFPGVTAWPKLCVSPVAWLSKDTVTSYK